MPRAPAMLAVLSLLSSPAHALPLTFVFEMEAVFGENFGALDPDVVALGTPLAGEFTVDTDTPDGDVSAGVGLFLEPVTSVSFSVDTYRFEFVPANSLMVILDDWRIPGGNFQFVKDEFSVTAGDDSDLFLNFVLAALTTSGESVDLIKSDRPEDIRINPFDADNRLSIVHVPGEFLVFGVVTSLLVVPDPTTALLVAIGLVGLAIRQRRRG